MKTNSITNSEISYNNYNKRPKAQSFKGIGSGFVVPMMDGIDRGGLATSFIIQDVCGSCLPRTWTGLHRNEDVTGKLNYQEATEVALREFITGPSMFAIPMAILYGCKKWIGKALDVPVKHLEGLSNILSKSSNIITKENLADPKVFKSQYYKEVFTNILESSTKDLSKEELSRTADEFAQTLIKIEKAKSKGIIKNIKNVAVAGSKEDLISEIADKFLALTKKSSGDTTRNLHIASISHNGEIVASSNIKKTLSMITNYTDDVINKAGKKLTTFDATTVKEFIENFKSRRIGGRFLLNFGMAASVAAFCMVIPKMYIRSKEFPGTKDLINGAKSQDGTVNNENK